jgi:hypothetical protein
MRLPCRRDSVRLRRWITGDIREAAKLMTAVGEPVIAYKRFNDFYMPGLGGDAATGWNRGYAITRLGIGAQDMLCRLSLLAYGLAGAVLFKGSPPQAMLEALRLNAFTVQRLPENQYA